MQLAGIVATALLVVTSAVLAKGERRHRHGRRHGSRRHSHHRHHRHEREVIPQPEITGYKYVVVNRAHRSGDYIKTCKRRGYEPAAIDGTTIRAAHRALVRAKTWEAWVAVANDKPTHRLVLSRAHKARREKRGQKYGAIRKVADRHAETSSLCVRKAIHADDKWAVAQAATEEQIQEWKKSLKKHNRRHHHHRGRSHRSRKHRHGSRRNSRRGSRRHGSRRHGKRSYSTSASSSSYSSDSSSSDSSKSSSSSYDSSSLSSGSSSDSSSSSGYSSSSYTSSSSSDSSSESSLSSSSSYTSSSDESSLSSTDSDSYRDRRRRGSSSYRGRRSKKHSHRRHGRKHRKHGRKHSRRHRSRKPIKIPVNHSDLSNPRDAMTDEFRARLLSKPRVVQFKHN